MIRRATAQDAAALDAFLSRHAATSMFLRGNLATHGIDQSDDPHATTFYLWDDGEIRAAMGRTNNGYLMCQIPDLSSAIMDGFASALEGATFIGFTGHSDQIAAMLPRFGVDPEADLRMHDHEPLYQLDLADMPEAQLDIRVPEARDVPTLETWFLHYEEDTGIAALGEKRFADAKARAQKAAEQTDVDIALLIEDGAPVAMASINARLPDIVQVGGVFVPREARNRQLGRKVVHALLQHERKKGVQTAVLFANNPAAARAYEAIGFQHIGSYTVALPHDAHLIQAKR
jgi:RimJ/RimL family protein N-acetyltransferase